MRAVVVHEFGPIGQHKLEDFPDPVPKDDEVLIDVHAIGINFPDTLMLQGLYQTRPDCPFVPGRDAAGVVTAVGSNVTRFKPGDRVMAQVVFGAYGEKLVSPEYRVFPMPASLDFVSAAGMITTYNTAYVAVALRGNVGAGQTVLITGASGGVGLAMVEVAKALGATVLAGATSREKGDLAIAHGADHWIDLGIEDLRNGMRDQVAAITGEALCAAVFDVVGGDVFDAGMRCVGYGGSMVIVGFATLDISMPKGHHILLKNISVIGAPVDIHLRNEPEDIHAGMARMMKWYEAGSLRPEITATYPLDDIHAALARFADRSVTGKLVVTTGRD
jgi:NADPH2:quinone reductase